MMDDAYLSATLYGDDPTPPGPTPGPWHPTRAQLVDLQGNLAVYVPQIKPSDYGVRAGAAGVDAGWFWLNWLPRLRDPVLRQVVYAAVKAKCWTHVCQNLSAPDVGEGYHSLAPVTQADRDGYGAAVTTILDECDAQRLIVIGAGLTPGAPAADGIDHARIRVAMNAWDDSANLYADLKFIAAQCPNALIYLEMPGPGDPWPQPSGGDEPVVPAADNGGAWLRACQQRFPNFVGVLHELGSPNDFDGNVAYLKSCAPFWRDVQRVLFETDLYWIFWQNRSPDESRAYNDRLAAACPELKGYFGGCTSHPPPGPDPGVIVKPYIGDEIPIGSVSTQGGLDLASFAQTARILKLTLGSALTTIAFDKADGPGRWPDQIFGSGPDTLQFSVGLALKRDGQWYAAAPIERWHGANDVDAIQKRNVDAQGRGQIQANWFDYPRFGKLQGYQPAVGEAIGLFVCAGDWRNSNCPLLERSNIVEIPLPADGQAVAYEWQ